MNRRIIGLALVALQFVLIAALVLLPWTDPLWHRDAIAFSVAGVLALAGAIIAVLGVRGLGRSLTANPVPLANSELVTDGLYGWVRHPIYSGLLVGSLGIALAGASWWHLGTWLALVVLLMIKARWEERMLVERYVDYADYALRVGRFIPGVGRIG
ncbi:isoprenylcysteine carboxylmethyltransferase family protein [Salinibacterium sp. NG253]|uniref:methyltransferase family protein n=1 Tax=Salinibacterium sp. NG253 TaxID=2792039 RepID=UPI0018CD4BF1|nr:isoprenylcysteine carboxylmethyltransferase family protein [Salinibacterium sp. NG253]MBH0116561.1 isoprenylcysteine carboxylmethyltransferase family protein [Salinibacterium sp. NG253]